MGLKGDVDYNNQLNTIYLDDTLSLGVSYGLNLVKIKPILPTDLIITLEVPLSKIIGLFIITKADGLLDLMQKISSMVHFGRSINDYFAHDVAL